VRGRVRLSQILKVFGWIGLTSLGGGRSVYVHAGLVVRRKWITNHEFIQDLTLPQLLARSGVQDWVTGTLALRAAVVLYGRWLPPIALVLAAGLAGWLAGL
jgi:chromate transport protein ChrA